MQDRATQFARYILDNKTTIRDTAFHFGFSKSTVHNDIQKKVKKNNFLLYLQVEKILQTNFREKHIRGGEATRKKYLKNTN